MAFAVVDFGLTDASNPAKAIRARARQFRLPLPKPRTRLTLLYAHRARDGLLEEEPHAHDAKDLDAGSGHVHHERLHRDGLGGRGREFPCFLLAEFVEVDVRGGSRFRDRGRRRGSGGELYDERG